MTINQTMDYYIWPRHLYSHSRTCTRSSLCRRPSRLVASHIFYLLDRASVHEISALVTWFQHMSDISSHYGDHDPLYIFIMEILIYLYCMWKWTHMSYYVSCLFHGHCTLMYLWLLYLLAVMCRVLLLYCTIGWLVHPPDSSSLHFLDGLIMYFSHRITPLTSHIRGHLLQLILPHTVDHMLMAFPFPL